MNVSIILATYNQPIWLEKVLCGYAAQRHRDFEIVIADDGSTQETAAVIRRLRRSTGLSIEHVWHKDDGFRKCRILNKAILRTQHDYLVFSDGDIIPRDDFLTTHVEHAARGRFLSGGVVRLPMPLSEQIDTSDIQNQRATNGSWLLRNGLKPNRKCLMLTASRWQAKLLDYLTTTRATWNGHNASGWKTDLLQVNGFDERMGYGGEDRELGERLMNMGIRPSQIRHKAVCVHLEHGRGYVREDILRWNKEHRKTVRQQQVTWTHHGITEGAEDTTYPILPFHSETSQSTESVAPQAVPLRKQETGRSRKAA